MQPTAICPRRLKILNLFRDWASQWDPKFNGDSEYQVEGPKGTFVVNLRARTCACGKWQLCGIPCEHAISCIFYNQESPENYVHSWFKVGTYLEAYVFPIHPLNDPNQWKPSESAILRAPTFETKKPGPDKTKRRLEAWELERKKKDKNGREVTVMTKAGQKGKCSICKVFGHNKRKHANEV
ncbi:hypothetical protein LINGRAPRIM_LOCUS2989 [Linum grandiflorum]